MTATGTSPQGQPVLSLRKVDKSFGAVHVLRGVDLDTYPGKVTALVGDNGAGKSTLIKAVAGIHPFDGGEMLLGGRARSRCTAPSRPTRSGSRSSTRTWRCATTSTSSTTCSSGARSSRRLTLNETEMEKRAGETLRGLSVRTLRSLRQQVSSLSGGQRQTVAIARAVLWNSKLVILDEPTAALGVAQTEQVLNLVRRLADNGLAVILITHNMNDVFQVADNIACLYLGQMAAQVDAKEVSHGQVVELITAGRSGDMGLKPEVAAANVGGEA